MSSGYNNQNFVLEKDVLDVNEVVVTALGVSKEKKALGYSVQDVKSEKLTMVEQENVVSGRRLHIINNSGNLVKHYKLLKDRNN